MTDDRLDALLPLLEGPARPDAAFADRLFDELAREAGMRGPAPGGRVRHGPWFGLGQATAMRLAWLAVLAALLIALGVIVVGIGGQRSPFAIAPSPSVASPTPSPTASLPSDPPQPRIASGVMGVGDPAPNWSATLLDGIPFSTEDLIGRPAAVFIWCSCSPGPQARLFLEAAEARQDELGLVLVSVDSEGTTSGLVEWLDAQTPVVHDAEMGLLGAWQLDGWPALVLLGADGTLADIQPATFGEPKLTALLDALVAGEPIPDPDPVGGTADASTEPDPLTTVLEVGAEAPELDGPRLGGGELSTTELRGRPTVVQFWLPARADGTPQDDSPPPDVLLDELARRGDAVGVLLVSAGEWAPGDAGAYLERRGADVPVIFDWAGELNDRWGLVMTQTLVVLDAEGRVLGYFGPEALSDPAPALALLDAAVSSSPSPDPGAP